MEKLTFMIHQIPENISILIKIEQDVYICNKQTYIKITLSDGFT